MQSKKHSEAETMVEAVPKEGHPPESTIAPAMSSSTKRSKRIIACGIVLPVVLLAALTILVNHDRKSSSRATEAISSAPSLEVADTTDSNLVRIDDQQMQSIKLELVGRRSFRAEKIATGKIGFNEDVMTPVFSPYTGRVIRLIARPGEDVEKGAPLFEIDTPDLVQAEQDLISASIAVPKTKTLLNLATRGEDRQHRLYLNKAVALKEWEQAEADMKNAERDLHSAESALAAAHSRLRAFGKSDEEIAKIENERQIDRTARVGSPLAGTIVARKVGPGQYVKPDSPDPLFTIADLSTVWLLADVYEADVPLIKVRQRVEVHVAAYPNEAFTARIAYVSPSVDPITHRVGLRSVVENRGRRLKPEMIASFRVVTNSETQSLAVPTGAIVREGDRTSVWVAQGRNHFARRDVTTAIQQGGYVQIVSGLQLGERVVSEGSLFIGNSASS